MAEVAEQHQASVLGVQQVAKEDTDKYGIVCADDIAERVGKVSSIVEKPKPEDAPSTQAVVGRYILSHRIFDILETTGRGAGGEIQLTDAIAQLLTEETVVAYEFNGKRYDCGDKLGYLQATVEYALKHPNLQHPFREYLKTYCTID